MRIWLKKDLSAEVWKLAGPVVVGMISQTLMNVVDTAMVGRLGAVALAATGLGGLLSWMVLGTLGGLATGVQAISARRYGEGDPLAAGKVLDNGIFIALVVGSVCSLLFSWGMSRIFFIFTEDPAVVVAGSGYISYRLLSGLPFMLMSAYRGFFNGIGKTKPYMRVVIVANMINVALNYALIFGKFGFPRMEAPGAGLATSIANIIGVVYFIIIAVKYKHRRQFRYHHPANCDLTVCRSIINLALPAGMQVLLSMIGYAAFIAIVARIGTIELATTNVCITIWSVAFLPGVGIGVAAAALIGQKLGEKKPDKAEAYGWESVRLGMIVMGIIGLSFLAVPDLIFRIFTDNPAVIAAGRIPLRILGLIQIFDATGMVLSQALQGAGMNRWVLIVEIITNWGFFVPCTAAVVFLFGWGLNAAWLVMACYLIIFGATVTIKFAGGKWKEVKL